MPPSELRKASGEDNVGLVEKLSRGGTLPGLPLTCNVDEGPAPTLEAVGGELYPLVGAVLLVGGGGTRVAPLTGPIGNSGALAVPPVPAGANGPVAIDPPIERWQPACRRHVNGSSKSKRVFAGRVMAGLFSCQAYTVGFR